MKSSLKPREDRQMSCFGIVEFNLLVYIQVEIGFTGLKLSREPSGLYIISSCIWSVYS